MKHCKKLTRKHKIFLKTNNYDPEDFMFLRDDFQLKQYVFFNKHTGQPFPLNY